jgi:hypothetical protein
MNTLVNIHIRSPCYGSKDPRDYVWGKFIERFKTYAKNRVDIMLRCLKTFIVRLDGEYSE